MEVAVVSSTGVISALIAGRAGVNLWGASLDHTAAANCSISDGTDVKIKLRTVGAGSDKIMFDVPVFLTTDIDVDILSAGEVLIYYSGS